MSDDYEWTYKGRTEGIDGAYRDRLTRRYGRYSTSQVMHAEGGCDLPKPNYKAVPNVLLRGTGLATWGLTPAYRLVLLYLWSWHDHTGDNEVSRGVRKIAEETDLSTKVVVQALDHLEGLGWLTCVDRNEFTNRKVYRINTGPMIAALNDARDGRLVSHQHPDEGNAPE